MSATKHTPMSAETLLEGVQDRLKELAQVILETTSSEVKNGPFKGQILVQEASWGDGDVIPKILGCYEAELHAPIEAAILKSPDIVVNVGCAEGYYAIGLAQRLPVAHVLAYDICPSAQAIAKRAARTNGVSEQITVNGECTADRLMTDVASASRGLIFLDCEGAEVDLITAENAAKFSHCDLIIECHDFLDETITPKLQERLAPTHDIAIYREGPRDPSGYPILQTLTSFDRWMAMCEFRPCLMHWLVATPKN